MRKHIFRILFAIPLMLVLAALFAWYGLLHTTAGAGWVLGVVQKQLPGMLSVDEPEGTLSSGLTLTNLRFMDDGMEAGAKRMEFVLVPGLLPPRLSIERPVIDKLTLWMEEESDDSSTELPDSMALPIPVEIGELVINGLVYLAGNHEPQFHIQSVAASATIHESLDLHRLQVDTGGIEAAAAGRLGLLHPFSMDLAFNASGTLELLSLIHISEPTRLC